MLTAASISAPSDVVAGNIDAGFPLVAPIEQAAIERNVTRQFKAFVDEIERQATRSRAQPAHRAK